MGDEANEGGCGTSGLEEFQTFSGDEAIVLTNLRSERVLRNVDRHVLRHVRGEQVVAVVDCEKLISGMKCTGKMMARITHDEGEG